MREYVSWVAVVFRYFRKGRKFDKIIFTAGDGKRRKFNEITFIAKNGEYASCKCHNSIRSAFVFEKKNCGVSVWKLLHYGLYGFYERCLCLNLKIINPFYNF